SMEANGKQIRGEDDDFVFIFKGDRWSLHVNGNLSQGGTVRQIEVKGKHNTIDLPITEGTNIGTTAISIYAVDGDTLRYLNSAEPRATEFATKPGDGRVYSVLRRAKVQAVRPPEIRFESAVFATDLVVPDSKKAIHRVSLRCRIADGESGTLTLDP